MLFDGTNVNLLIAFLGGVITFFASCLLPLVPTYLAYLVGFVDDEKIDRRETFLNTLFFTLGFIAVFIFLGATVNFLGTFFALYKIIFQQIGGLFLIFVALFMLGILKNGLLHRSFKINIKNLNITPWKKINSLFFGFTFGFAWTPCIGPVLGVILFWASQEATMLKGIFLLLFYGLGLGLPFLIIGVLVERLMPLIKKSGKIGHILNIIAAIFILLTGILLIFGKLGLISVKLIELFNLRSLSV